MGAGCPLLDPPWSRSGVLAGPRLLPTFRRLFLSTCASFLRGTLLLRCLRGAAVVPVVPSSGLFPGQSRPRFRAGVSESLVASPSLVRLVRWRTALFGGAWSAGRSLVPPRGVLGLPAFCSFVTWRPSGDLGGSAGRAGSLALAFPLFSCPFKFVEAAGLGRFGPVPNPAGATVLGRGRHDVDSPTQRSCRVAEVG